MSSILQWMKGTTADDTPVPPAEIPPGSDFTYPKVKENSINRHKERGHYDAATIHTLLNTTPFATVSFIDPSTPFPVSLPMICRVGSFRPDEPPAVYVHGYVSARLFRLPAEPSSSTPPTAEDNAIPGDSSTPTSIPLTISATVLDSLVLALTPFNHSYNYRSCVLHGHASLLPPTSAEALFAMRLITDGVVPGRFEDCRELEDGEIKATRILRVQVVSASAKVRDVGVREEKRDLRRVQGERERGEGGGTWTGCVPVYQHLATPIPAATNVAENVPEYLTDFIRDTNARAKSEAMAVSIPH